LDIVFLLLSGGHLGLSFICFILSKHALEILTLLGTFVDHHPAFMLHLVLESRN
jgi:hypothetical protein